MLKRSIALLMCVVCLLVAPSCGLATEAVSPDGLELSEAGFLPGDAAQDEYLWQDEESGLWCYITKSLSIVITRHEDENDLSWFEADVKASPESPLSTYLSEGKKPGQRLSSPLTFVKNNQIVLGITDDFSGYRIKNGHTVGIVIRNGQIFGKKTRNSSRQRGWPNLDTLAVYPDGSMKAYVCDAYTAEEYIEQGAQNVFAFGPVMISNGELSDEMKDESYYPYNEPRLALGMIEPYHYIIIAAVGRDGESNGATMQWVAAKMLELGVTEALNLDGGGTAVLMFMGKVLNRSEKNMRSVNSLIGFGVSTFAQSETP